MIRILAAWLLACVATFAGAQANLEINTPAINNLKKAMAERHTQLSPYYLSGAVGIARDGSIALANANAAPLPQRAGVGGLIAAENTDRSTLYREIARANGKPEWEAEIRNTFGQRWIEKAQVGWSVQNAAGQWVKK